MTEKSNPTGYWYCPSHTCDCEVDLTFEETCANCGGPVIWVELDQEENPDTIPSRLNSESILDEGYLTFKPGEEHRYMM